ncbi:MAG: lipopolysaccharide heptosyltransferase II [bacterium]|nr:lipopolysaccharide heptosyltransferase II [bacterium]
MTQSILIRTPNHLGDCIMALPMIGELREAYPGSKVTLLVPEMLAAVFSQNLSVDEIITIPAEHMHGLISVMKIKELIQPKKFDVGYILPPSFGAAAGFKLAGIPERIGYVADGRRLLLTKPLPLSEPVNSVHRSRLFFNLLLRGSGHEMEYGNPKLFLNDADMETASAILGQFGIEEKQRLAVIAFRAAAESRRWGTENYTSLAKRLVADYGLKVALIGTASDQTEGDRIVQSASAGEVINLAGKTSIRDSAAIISHASFFVGNDSGAAHLAAAVGTPLVVLSGADDPRSTSPISPQKQVIYLDHLDCISCVKNKCPLKGDKAMQCMTDISVEMVLAAISKVIGN